MADRVHPMPPSPPRHPASPPPAPAKDPDADAAAAAATETTPLHPAAAAFHGPPPPPAPAPKPAYIVQIPKDQVLRVPPPDRARRYKSLSTRPARRRRLRRACCSACALLLLLLVAAAAFLGIVYLVFRPKPPSFSVSSINLRGLNATDPSVVSGSVAVRADNGGNRKVGVEYLSGGEVELSYDGSSPLAAGKWPAFVQAQRNVTDFTVAMATTGASFGGDERRRREAMAVEARVPVRLRFGKTPLRTWTVDVKATCQVTVDGLAGGGGVAAGSRGCRVKVRPFLWWWW
ncbi:NDR1/HIN1-like protein 13 [Brachypodium distachyon]|uniref:Late embryogenesis abundant protein LEA-2 subgroup domain-containing protein n=1 Tax=Brachypodium distachyon TaxID=15368 RepID=I1IUT6_BRADI|nr:NDR1/HIN1-like protein 13 [Brachypodium distachyon]KQJ92456.1 hypothetical protein BRADI_4g43800v3 [Brachypodium distachyon]|eukprot:XP_003578991.1 NDR1/HIN1-like protein 13 [Brachypodium distachyon]